MASTLKKTISLYYTNCVRVMCPKEKFEDIEGVIHQKS